jgi:TRAP transporter TAXI family solute receptor
MMHFIKGNAWVLLLIVIGVIVAIQFLEPAPPRVLTIATGSEEGGYYQYALRLQRALEEDGFTLNIRKTKGSIENLELLTSDEDETELAFVQSGVETLFSGDQEGLRGLGSLYYEPLWVFYRGHQKVKLLQDLKNSKMAIGSEGSGTNAVSKLLLEKNGMLEESSGLLREIGGADAAEAILAGEVDVAFFVMPAQNRLIKELASEPDLELMSFRRYRAYVGNIPFLSSVVIGEGLLDIAENVPERNLVLLSPLATLVCNDDFHPALTSLLLVKSGEILASGNLLEEEGVFPSAEHVGFKLTKEAEHFHKKGPPLLQRFLPFWIASAVDRLIILVIPFMALLIPLFKTAPPLYRWRIRSKIFRWYKFLREVDKKMLSGEINKTLEEDLKKLRDLQMEISSVDVPLSYTDELYDLHLHVAFVITRLTSLEEEPAECEGS